MKRLFFALMLGMSQVSFASWIDADLFAHRIEWTYLSDQSNYGRQAYSLYQNFSATSLDGTSHAYLQKKYQPKHPDMGIGFTTGLYESEETILKLETIYHTGQRSEKLSVEPSLKLGVQVVHVLKNRPESSMAILGGVSHVIGGKMKESACYDSFDREFNCRAAVSIVDAPLLNQKPENQTQFQVRFVWNKDFL